MILLQQIQPELFEMSNYISYSPSKFSQNDWETLKIKSGYRINFKNIVPLITIDELTEYSEKLGIRVFRTSFDNRVAYVIFSHFSIYNDLMPHKLIGDIAQKIGVYHRYGGEQAYTMQIDKESAKKFESLLDWEIKKKLKPD